MVIFGGTGSCALGAQLRSSVSPPLTCLCSRHIRRQSGSRVVICILVAAIGWTVLTVWYKWLSGTSDKARQLFKVPTFFYQCWVFFG